MKLARMLQKHLLLYIIDTSSFATRFARRTANSASVLMPSTHPPLRLASLVVGGTLCPSTWLFTACSRRW